MKVVGGQVFPAEKIRDYIKQQLTSITTGTEIAILTTLAGHFQDLCLIGGHNSSDAAITLDIRDKLAGTIRLRLTIPANEAKHWIFYIPFKQTTAGNVWTADMGDYTGTTITMYVQAVKNKG